MFWNLGNFFSAATYSGDNFPVILKVFATARSRSEQKMRLVDDGGGRRGGSNRSFTQASTDSALCGGRGGSDGGIEVIAAVEMERTAAEKRRRIAMDLGLRAMVIDVGS